MSDLISTNKVLMRRIFEETWNEGKPALAVEIFAQPAGVERFVNQFLESFPDLHHAVEEIIADGDQVTVKFSAQGTHNGQWLEFAPHRPRGKARRTHGPRLLGAPRPFATGRCQSTRLI